MSPPAPDDPAERKARHLAYVQRVQVLTMRLIEATAAKAEQAPEPAEPPEPEAPQTRAPDPILGFVRLTRALNHTIALENRIATDDLARRPRAYRAPIAATSGAASHRDPRRPLLQDAFYRATKSHPDRARRRRDIDAAIDEHLAADPAQTIPVLDILQRISEDLDLPLDPAHLSDEILGSPPRDIYRPSG